MRITQILRAMYSILIGVGSKKRLTRELEDVEKNGPLVYIIAGLIMTGLFIMMVLFAVQFALSQLT